MNFSWSADEATSFRIMDAALAAGINFFDTADVYSHWVPGNKGGESETIIGKWLKQQDRRSLVIGTKVRGRMWDGPNGEGLSRAHIVHAVEDSLRRLQTDYIDLYQAHWYDEETPLEETLEAFDQLVRSGKVLYIGMSNFPAWRLTKSLWISDVRKIVRFDCLQPHYSLLHRNEFEWELEEVCLDQGIGVIPYSPLAAGFLTGKYTRENRTPETARAQSGLIRQLIDDDRAYEVLDQVRAIATAHNVPVAQVALAWMLARPSITSAIIGARTVDQLQELTGAAELQLSEQEITTLTEATKGY
jgi:aryl-alcohol dehydrogenase-like predicted oxidoreductase